MDDDYDPWDTEFSNLERQRARRERERRAQVAARGTVADFGPGGHVAWDQWAPIGDGTDDFTGAVDTED